MGTDACETHNGRRSMQWLNTNSQHGTVLASLMHLLFTACFSSRFRHISDIYGMQNAAFAMQYPGFSIIIRIGGTQHSVLSTYL